MVRIASLLPLLLWTCGSNPRVMDAGVMIDTSCGLDCDAQRHYGLLAGQCFAYSGSPTVAATPPVLGALVLPAVKLEGDLSVVQVEYRQGGQLMMKDSFTMPGGELKLMRREWPTDGQSVTYKNDDLSAIVGVSWLQRNTSAGEALTSTVKADLILDRSSTRDTKAVSYRATFAAPNMNELKTPFQTLDGGLTVLLGETPDNGTDPRRLFVPDLGFAVIASPLKRGGTASSRYLQAVFDGGVDCSL